MNEAQFVRQNKEKWIELEELLNLSSPDPDRLEQLFNKVSGDLSYARTFFPNRSVRLYLNQLTLRVFDRIQKKSPRLSASSFKEFFTYTLPFELYRSRSYLIYSLIIFIGSVLIGVVSSANHPEFFDIILGSEYVHITEDNINSGDPMAIYKDEDASDMFVGITTNNLRVALLSFIMGIFASLGSFVVLVYNGVMVGTFQYLFYSKGLFLTSFLTIWIHGTLEISAIIIAGGAGLLLGSGLLFPGTYSRMAAMQISVRRALRIFLSTVPLILFAGFLESFATRHTEWPAAVKLLIIVLSLALILYIYVYLPKKQYHKIKDRINEFELTPHYDPPVQEPRLRKRNVGELFSFSLSRWRRNFPKIFSLSILPNLIIAVVIFWFVLSAKVYDDALFHSVSLFSEKMKHPILFIYLWLSLTQVLITSAYYSVEDGQRPHRLIHIYPGTLLPALAISLLWVATFYYVNTFVLIIISLAVPAHFMLGYLDSKISLEQREELSLGKSFHFGYETLLNLVPVTFTLGVVYYLLYTLLNSGMMQILSSVLYWHQWIDHYQLNVSFIEGVINYGLFLFFIPFAFFVYSDFFQSAWCGDKAIDLWNKLTHFGIKQTPE